MHGAILTSRAVSRSVNVNHKVQQSGKRDVCGVEVDTRSLPGGGCVLDDLSLSSISSCLHGAAEEGEY